MRLDIEFAKPLSKEQRTALLLALAALPKTARVRFTKGGRCAQVMGEALGVDRVRSALLEEGVEAEVIHTSLNAEDDRSVDEVSDEQSAGQERLRPIGR